MPKLAATSWLRELETPEPWPFRGNPTVHVAAGGGKAGASAFFVLGAPIRRPGSLAAIPAASVKGTANVSDQPAQIGPPGPPYPSGCVGLSGQRPAEPRRPQAEVVGTRAPDSTDTGRRVQNPVNVCPDIPVLPHFADGWRLTDRHVQPEPSQNPRSALEGREKGVGDDMSDKRLFLTPKQARRLLPLGRGHVHVFSNSAAGIMIGADWNRKDVLRVIREGKLEIGGEQCMSAGHGLVMWDGETDATRRPLYVQTRKDIDWEAVEREASERMPT